MLPSPKIIKYTARAQLKNKWVSAVCVSLIFLATVIFNGILAGIISSVLISASSLVFAVVLAFFVIFMLFLTIPLFQGVIRWFWFFSIEKELDISSVFYYYSDAKLLGKTIVFYSQLIFALIIRGILVFIPAILYLVLSSQQFYEMFGIVAPTILPVLWPLGYLLYFVCGILFLILAQKFALAPGILATNDDITVDDAIVLSKYLSAINRNAFISFALSFIGWGILCLLGVTMIFILPYMFMAYAVFTKFTISNHRYEQGKMGEKAYI